VLVVWGCEIRDVETLSARLLTIRSRGSLPAADGGRSGADAGSVNAMP
jgi:hypothetical protein